MEISINILKKSSLKTYSHDSVIIEEGVSGGHIYILIDGKIQVTKNNTFITHITQGGSIIGEVSLLLGCPYLATCRSIGETNLYEVQITTKFLEENPNLLLMIAKELAEKLKKATTELAAHSEIEPKIGNSDQAWNAA